MRLDHVLTEEKVTALADNELLSKAYNRIVGAALMELEESFRLAMIEYFPTFKFGPPAASSYVALSREGTFELYGEKFTTTFSTSGFSIRLKKGTFGFASNDSQTVKVFAEKVYAGMKDMLTKRLLELKPESQSFRHDFLKLQQDFVDRDLEVEIDHVPDKKTVITVESEDKKLRFKVKLK